MYTIGTSPRFAPYPPPGLARGFLDGTIRCYVECRRRPGEDWMDASRGEEPEELDRSWNPPVSPGSGCETNRHDVPMFYTFSLPRLATQPPRGITFASLNNPPRRTNQKKRQNIREPKELDPPRYHPASPGSGSVANHRDVPMVLHISAPAVGDPSPRVSVIAGLTTTPGRAQLK